MAASSDPGVVPSRSRRRRYFRSELATPVTVTPAKRALLRYVAEYRMVSLPQLARLLGASEKATRRHMRALFDSGWVHVVPLPRVALAPPEQPNDARLLYGSAPGVYTLTREGGRLLQRLGWEGELPPATSYGPRNTLLLSHELAIRDVRIWLELCSRRYAGHRLERWHEGREAEIDLQRQNPPKVLRPDVLFLYRLGQKALVGLVEVDLATERGGRRWGEKLAGYTACFERGCLEDKTGFANARILVFTPEARRREALGKLIAAEAPNIADRCWLTTQSETRTSDLRRAVWSQPGSQVLKPLVPTQLLNEEQ